MEQQYLKPSNIKRYMTVPTITSSKRIDSIDIAKGIGIILVVLFHTRLNIPPLYVIWSIHSTCRFSSHLRSLFSERGISAQGFRKKKMDTNYMAGHYLYAHHHHYFILQRQKRQFYKSKRRSSIRFMFFACPLSLFSVRIRYTKIQ